MKTLTEQLFELGKGIIEQKPEISDSTGRYHMADDGGVEIEVGEFLYGLTRVLQPNYVLTTGIYSGISDMYIAQALKDNRHGGSIAIEYEEHHIKRAKALWEKLDLLSIITVSHGSSLDYQPLNEYELLFLDTEPSIRFQELVKFYPYLKAGGYIGIHDLHRHLSQTPNEQGFGWPYGPLPEIIKEWIKTDKLRVVSFPTPRGLTFFYKPAEGDYRI